MSQPTPAERLRERLTHLPPDGSRDLMAALDRAQARAQAGRRPVLVTVVFEVGPEGIDAIELPARYERRGSPRAGA